MYLLAQRSISLSHLLLCAGCISLSTCATNICSASKPVAGIRAGILAGALVGFLVAAPEEALAAELSAGRFFEVLSMPLLELCILNCRRRWRDSDDVGVLFGTPAQSF